jgi:hypothetical protein
MWLAVAPKRRAVPILASDATRLSLTCSPNPSAQHVTLRYETEHDETVSLCLYDMLGRRTTVLDHVEVLRGIHQERVALEALPSGQYICVLRTASKTAYATLLVSK